MAEIIRFQKTMQMGLGEAIQRLNLLHAKINRGIATSSDRSEHGLILEALNQTKLDLGFDCDLDGVPDTIAIFAQSAQTSCCKIMPTQSSRRKPTKKVPSKRGTSRRKK
jgi:hypothetical protein